MPKKTRYYLVSVSDNLTEAPHHVNNRIKSPDSFEQWYPLKDMTFPLDDQFSFKNMTIGLDRLAIVRHHMFKYGDNLKLVNDDELKRLMIEGALTS